MTLDLVIVEDDQRVIPHLTQLVKTLEMNPLIFTNSIDCIAYLEQVKSHQQPLPIAYMVDMKLKGDLEGSEALFWFMKENLPDQLAHFYFVSGHRSHHDEQVLERTGAMFYFKENVTNLLATIKKEYT